MSIKFKIAVSALVINRQGGFSAKNLSAVRKEVLGESNASLLIADC